MKVRYGSELKRLQQERNLLLWAFILLTLLWWATVALYERRLEQMEDFYRPQGSTPARASAQGAFSVSERSGSPAAAQAQKEVQSPARMRAAPKRGIGGDYAG